MAGKLTCWTCRLAKDKATKRDKHIAYLTRILVKAGYSKRSARKLAKTLL